MKISLLNLSLLLATLIHAETNSSQLNFEDKDVQQTIIDQATELIGIDDRDGDGITRYHHRIDHKPFTDSGWGVFRFPNNNLKAIFRFDKGLRHGLCTFWHENGQMAQQGAFFLSF